MKNSKLLTHRFFVIDKEGNLLWLKKNNSRKLVIPEGVQCFTYCVFEDLYKKECLVLPSTLRFFSNIIMQKNFKDVINHSPILFDWWIENHKYNDKTLNEMEEIDLSKYVNSDGKPFTIIDGSFNNSRLKKFNTGSFVTEISNLFFENCDKLKCVEIDQNVQSIMNMWCGSPETNCPKLKPENVINHSSILFDWWIENHKYSDKTLNEMNKINLDKYTNSDNKPFTKIENCAFCNETLLQRIIIGSSVNEIGDFAFSDCQNLEYAEIGKNVQSIYAWAFDRCPKLKSENVISHSPVLFRWWVNNHKYNGKTLNEIKTINLDKYTNSDGKLFAMISENAFFGCCNLKNILLGNSIKRIDEQAFRSCRELKNIQITNKDISFNPKAFNDLQKPVNFYVRNKQIKEKLRKIGINSKQIFIKPIPKEELEETEKTKENKIEFRC